MVYFFFPEVKRIDRRGNPVCLFLFNGDNVLGRCNSFKILKHTAQMLRVAEAKIISNFRDVGSGCQLILGNLHYIAANIITSSVISCPTYHIAEIIWRKT